MSVLAAVPSRLIRVMKKIADGKPSCGDTANTLGVRETDIPVDAERIVYPRTGGLSVTPDDPARLPIHVRLPRHGGRGRLPVFEIAFDALGNDLAYSPDPGRPRDHGFVEPSRAMRLTEYQTALHATRPMWMEIV